MNKTINLSKRVFTALLTVIITVTSTLSIGFTAGAEETKSKTIITDLVYEAAGTGGTDYNDSYIRADEYGQYLWVSGKLTTESGEPISDRSVKVYYVNKDTSSKRYSSGTTDENGVFHARIGGKSYFTDESSYGIYAEFTPSSKTDKNTYENAATEEELFTVQKQEKPVLSVSPEHQTNRDGSITVTDAKADAAYQYATENPALSGRGNTDLYDFTGNTASALSKGIYYVRAKAYVSSGENNILYLASDYSEAEIEKVDYRDYTVTLKAIENAVWKGNGGNSTFKLKEETESKSVYITPDEGFFVSTVYSVPENGATVIYDFETGEVFVENIKSDITLIPIVEEKKIPTNLQVEYRFLSDGNYSEESPAVKVEFTVTVTDQNGEPAADATVYFSQDGDKFTTRFLQTDNEGKVVFQQTYALDGHASEESWASQFALDIDYTFPVTQELRIVSQKKTDLVLYTSQIIGTAPNENNGKVINVPDNYQLWTGEVSQGAIVITAGNNGEWIYPVNGEFSGLSAGQHILRAGEYADYETNTFYLASGFADFFIPRGIWKVTVDLENSEHIVLYSDAVQAAGPGSPIYIYVEPEEGYKITSYEVDNPSYVSGSVNYSETDGVVSVESVSGNITLTVKAEKIEIPENEPNVKDEQEKTPKKCIFKWLLLLKFLKFIQVIFF